MHPTAQRYSITRLPLNGKKQKVKDRMKTRNLKAAKPSKDLLPLDDDEDSYAVPNEAHDGDSSRATTSRQSPCPQLSMAVETSATEIHADAGDTPMDAVADEARDSSRATISRQSPGPQLSMAVETSATEIHADAGDAPMDAIRMEAHEANEKHGGSVANDIHAVGSQSSQPNVSNSLPGLGDQAAEKDFGNSADSRPKSRLPLGKKRQPASIAPVGRVTRSSSRQREQNSLQTQSKMSLKRSASGKIKTSVPKDAMDTDPVEESSALPLDDAETFVIGAGNFMLAKTPSGSKSFMKPASSPSPSKIARATSLFIKPTITNVSHTFSTDSSITPIASTSGSSLFTLSNALEKLLMPPPSRPNTSMGFNRDASGSDDDDSTKHTSKDDSALNPSGAVRPAVGLKRSATIGTGAVRGPAPSSPSKAKRLIQKPISTFFKRGTGTNAPTRATRNGRVPLFGVGGPARKTVSKKSDLPTVVGSPNKTSNAIPMVSHGFSRSLSSLPQRVQGQMDPPPTPCEQTGGDVATAGPSNPVPDSLKIFGDDAPVRTTVSKKSDLPTVVGSPSSKKTLNASRRVSMVSHALSQSLNSLPQRVQGQMDPSPTPAGQTGGDVATAGPSNPVPESLKILEHSVLFVDVRTDEGDEAGSLFVEMLEGIGAKVLTRVGQTCTHIVYKNGLMSTLTRYRLLRDPKPLVVGIGWVVECVEQRKHVDETNFLVDLEGVNVAGINKRRRSFLPKLFVDVPEPGATDGVEENGGDRSIDLSGEVELAPLERARRRKSMLFGP